MIHRERDFVAVKYEDIEHETDQAVLFEMGGGRVWLPKSQIETIEDEHVWIPKWLAKEKDLKYE